MISNACAGIIQAMPHRRKLAIATLVVLSMAAAAPLRQVRTPDPDISVAASFADIDNDGDQDRFVTMTPNTTLRVTEPAR